MVFETFLLLFQLQNCNKVPIYTEAHHNDAYMYLYMTPSRRTLKIK